MSDPIIKSLMRIQKAAEARNCPSRVEFGVFEWNQDGKYSRETAKKVYKRASSAEAYAGSRNLVVRTLDPATGQFLPGCPRRK